MDFSIATLLSLFSDDKLVAGKVLEKKLGCDDDQDIESLQIILDVLERLGILVKERGKYRRVTEENLIEAKLRCSSKGFCFAIQDDEDADDIYIREAHLSNAWNGDRVMVRIIKDGTRRRSPEGEVCLILDRANPSLLAQVKQTNDEFHAVPLDDRLLFELMLKANGEDLTQAVDHLVHVSVVRYAIGENPPIGKITKVLGSDAEAAADTDIVSCKHDLPLHWPEETFALAEKLRWGLDSVDLKQRRDLRDLLTMTFVDDRLQPHHLFIENAFSLEKKDDNWLFGLHITDIAHYIPSDSPLDRAAKKRGTTVYLGDQICSLLPDTVKQKTSLVPGQDRLALSFFLTLGENGSVLGFNYDASVIQVDRQFSFSEVQALLASSDSLADELIPFQSRFQDLFFTLSALIKSQRLQRGGFEMPSDTFIPFLDEGRLGMLLLSESFPLSALLKELVILTQKCVAEHLSALAVPAIYCSQPKPDWEELTDLLKLVTNLGLEQTFDTEADVKPQDYALLTQAFAKLPSSRILYHLLEETLKTEKFSSHPAPHFGLAYEAGYVHIVSPGQRYADLVSQRILKLILEEGRDRRTKQSKVSVNLSSSECHGQINWSVLPPSLDDSLADNLHHLVSQLNEREKIAEDAEKDLRGLKKSEKMKERTGQIFRGLITGVQSYGFFVELEELLVEGLVHVSSLKDDWYEFRARHSCLIGRKNHTAYRLGSEVEVQVKSVDYYRQQIDLVTVAGGTVVTASEEDWQDE